MNRHGIISICLIVVLILVPAYAYATLTTSFGGKVILTEIPDVTCYSDGTGPIVLASNIENLAVAAVSASGVGGQTTQTRVGGTVAGLFGAIPFYTNYGFSASGAGFHFVGSTPKVGDWILGNVNVVPSFSTCDLQLGPYQIPFPVRTSSDYKTSSNTGNSGF
jgi:hypothetical protein